MDAAEINAGLPQPATVAHGYIFSFGSMAFDRVMWRISIPSFSERHLISHH
jgi:hypothetical protein